MSVSIEVVTRLVCAIALGVTLLALLPAATPAARAADNPIVIENRLPGNPASEWDVAGSGDASIQGFTDDFSYNRGQTVVFRIKTDAAAYRLDIYRVGYYGGTGARKVAAGIAGIARTQPACKREETTGLVDCGNWLKSASWPIPSTATSGIYFARLVRADTGGASHVFFVVRHDGSKSAILVQTSDTTWQAYNTYGGNSLYVGDPGGRAYKVSYNRPFVWRTGTAYAGISNFFNAEYPMVRWLEANGYDVTYFGGVDADRRGQLIKKHELFISMGHDEYWSAQQRSSVEAALAAGVNLAFFSGNEVFWKTRWENSIDGRNKARRTLVCYKETHENRRSDPLDPPTWTGTWRDPRFSPPADGGKPENGLTGQLFTVNGVQFNDLKVGAPFRKMRLWRNTSLATMSDADPPVTLGKSILGFEWDEDVDNPARPRGLVRLSSSTWNVGGKLLDFGSSFAPGSATHSLTLYRHPSGAWVFGAGTIQWSWGLDATHDNKAGAPVGDPDLRIQQATVNLFADMGVQPQTLRSNLHPATASSDTRTPTSRITSPTDGETVERGQAVLIAGTATDVGGGVVGGVEVSVDGGASWHPAIGRENWSYAWVPTGLGARTIRVAAVDDSGNLEQAGTSVSVDVVAGSGPARIWGDTIVPEVISANDPNAIEVGVKFASDVSGSVSGIHFYKAAQNTGVHLGHLWRGDGTLLATAEFEDETASGWQHATFPSPVPINANTTYVASYYTEAGHYSFNSQYFSATGFDNAPLHALRTGVDGPNGVYVYGRSSFPLFPSSSYQASNYWIDVDFVPASGERKGTTIWANTAAPEIASVDDAQPIELGTRFQSDVDGRITALRFFKGSDNTGPHVGNLWSGDGKLLASAPFKTETPVGWQQVELQPPVTVKAGTAYVASYHTQSGHYAASVDDRAVPAVDSPPLFAPQAGEAGAGGLYRYGASGFPTRSRPATNYWVDVVFEETEPADVAGATATAAPDYAPRRQSVLVYPVGVEKKKTPQTADPLVPEARSFLNGGHPISPTGR